MMPETMGVLAKIPSIIGVKDATGKLERVSCQRMTCGADFIQLSGEDATALGFNAHGGVGCISVTANVRAAPVRAVPGGHAARRLRGGAGDPGPADAAASAIFVEPGLVARNTRCRAWACATSGCACR